MPAGKKGGGGGGQEGGAVGRRFSNYVVPNHMGIAQSSSSQLILAGGGTSLYDSIGVDVADVGDGGYALFIWHTYNMSAEPGDGFHFGATQMKEGTGSSVTTFSGTIRAIDQVNTDAQDFQFSGGVNFSAPGDGRAAEWGLNYLVDDPNRFYVNGASFLALPREDALHGGGSTLGIEGHTYAFPRSLTTSVVFDTAASSDDDITSTPIPFFVNSSGIPQHRTIPHLVITNLRVRSNTSTQARQLRWTQYIDDEDIFNVRSNNTTPGAARTGRGFQIYMEALSQVTPNFTQATVTNIIGSNPHHLKVVGNRWQSIAGGETLAAERAFIVSSSVFRTFNYRVVSTAQQSTASWSAVPAFSNNVVVTDANAKYWLIFSTDVHGNLGNNTRFRITRNGVPLTPNGTDLRNLVYPTMRTQGSGPGGASTDNSTLPYYMHWVDQPGSGTHVYGVEVIGGGSNNRWNCRDDGSDGFRGMFAVAELSFATGGYLA